MSTAAYLLINTDAGKEEEVVNLLKKIDAVKQAHIVTGLADVICYVETKDIAEIRDVIIKKIRGLQGIQRTVTCLAIDVSV